ncbi:MAG: alpha/beta fold hydrolase ['Candidatus Kapabacteria' thiocyanatum]|uniref:Serine aminopeptidase S33 domain-containing protein n=1 Tax=Candidatus Kapaibacterium thiocyanatum TaxID=1895771 RepID=A0A1M3KWR2_9BACT|nr:alpha/beta fold hydrolase ['Candidatus Kapabacteria' thiocyanatum]OJX56852.1 MAG: hypothetical protein BGO89_10005 ['Candidatus Kapabacteria' thiocyanatum]
MILRFHHLAIRCLLLLLPVAGGCTMDSFLFNPARLSQYDLADSVIPVSRVEAVEFSSGGFRIYGFFVRQPDSVRQKPHDVIIYSHGNKHHIGEYWNRVEYLYKAGFDVFIYDYRGYGRSEGTSSETGLSEDARAAYDYVTSHINEDSVRVTCYGYSLGAVAATVQAADRQPQPHAVILEAPFADGETLVRSGTLLDIPGGYLLDGTFDNKGRVRRIHAPLLILHGTDDRFIDMEANGRVLYDAANNPKTFIPVVGADHETLPATMGVRTYMDIIIGFIKGN